MRLLLDIFGLIVVDVFYPIRCRLNHSPFWVDSYLEGSEGWVMTIGCKECLHHRVKGGMFRTPKETA